MQGALDGGLDIPHSEKRFAGFKKDDKQLDAEVHRKYIFSGHVASYMRVRAILLSRLNIISCGPYLCLIPIWTTRLFVIFCACMRMCVILILYPNF